MKACYVKSYLSCRLCYNIFDLGNQDREHKNHYALSRIIMARVLNDDCHHFRGVKSEVVALALLVYLVCFLKELNGAQEVVKFHGKNSLSRLLHFLYIVEEVRDMLAKLGYERLDDCWITKRPKLNNKGQLLDDILCAYREITKAIEKETVMNKTVKIYMDKAVCDPVTRVNARITEVAAIKSIQARQIFDNHVNLRVEVDVLLSNGVFARAVIPEFMRLLKYLDGGSDYPSESCLKVC